MPGDFPTGMSNVTARHFQRVSRDIHNYNKTNYPTEELQTASNVHHYYHDANVSAMASNSLTTLIEQLLIQIFG
ncbi:hypothetical protein I4U23_001536 [Adineta vaga]|nr:hypothetical protein I4U23_001536 [Adineta vaga]